MKQANELAPLTVGTPVERLEDLRLLSGSGRFVDDHHPDGLLHASILRSSVSHGRIRSIDVRKARSMRGVRAIYLASDILAATGGHMPTISFMFGATPELEPFAQPVLANGKVRYVGEAIAVVVAESAALAEDAMEAIETDIESLAAVTTCEIARRNEEILFEEIGRNVAVTYVAEKGNASKVEAAYVRRERFRVHRHSAVCMEPRGVVAIWDEAAVKLTILGAAKMPFQNRRMLARQMDLPEECIDMIEGDVGGGFGVRGNFHPEDFLIPFAARRLRRPVKWIEDRRENLLNTNHSREVEIEIELACSRDGTILALRGWSSMDAGGYFRTSPATPARNVAQFLAGPYRIPNIYAESSLVMTNKCPIGSYRGPGRFEADFFRERLFDLAANDLGIDRVEFRRRNLPSCAEMPYAIATLVKPHKSEELDSGDYGAALDRCLRDFGWEEKAMLRGSLRDGRYHGLGIGCFIEGGAAGPRENARIEMHDDGTFDIYVGSANVGQGVETVMAQIAADALGVLISRIRVHTGSTTILKEGYGAYHSRSVVMGGSAILDAATNLKAALVRGIAHREGCPVEQVTLAPDLTFAQMHGARKEFAGLDVESTTAEGTFANLESKHTYAYGTSAAHVTVDPRTGHIELLDYLTVVDLGKIINPMTAKGQVVGAVVQGLGGSLLEHLQYDAEGQLLTGSLADYQMPTATDFPTIRAVVLEDYPSPLNPLGAKGGGEGGIVPVGGVISNAVADALLPLGVKVSELPLSSPKVWSLIQLAQENVDADRKVSSLGG